MRLKMEQSKLQISRVGTVVAQSADTVGPVLSIEVECPVKAVVNTRAQSTTHGQALDSIVNYMRDSGRREPDLVLPSARLYGRSGTDSSELSITAEVNMEIALDDHYVAVLMFIQPGNDIPCFCWGRMLCLASE